MSDEDYQPQESSEGLQAKPDQKSITNAIISAQEDIRQWNILSKKYKGSSELAVMPDALDEEVSNIRMGGLAVSDGLGEEELSAEADKVNRSLDTLRDQGIISRDQVPQSEQLMSVPYSGEISGLEPSEGRNMLIRETELRAEIGINIPAYFLEGLESIKFVDTDTPSAHPDRDSDGDPSNQKYRDGVKSLVMEDVYHEIFEHAKYMLTLDEMRSFEEAMEKDKAENGVQYVTWYSHETAKVDSDRGAVENFCEAGAMYLTNPYTLLVMAPAQYRAIEDLMISHLPENERSGYLNTIHEKVSAQRNELNAMGVSDKELFDYSTRFMHLEEDNVGLKDGYVAGRYFAEGQAKSGRIEIYEKPYLIKDSNTQT